MAENVTVNIQTALAAQVHITTISMSSEFKLIHLAHLVVCDAAMMKSHRSDEGILAYRRVSHNENRML